MVDGGTGGRTGCTERTAAIGRFASALRELRQTAGNPSFREMSGRSSAISHTTLHEAAQGNRLPSWSTTVEFVKACDADPADYRARWDDANRQVRAATTAPSAELPVAAPAADDTPAAEDTALEPTGDDAPSGLPPLRRPVLLGVAAVVTVVAAVLGIVLVGRNDDTADTNGSGQPRDGLAAGPAAQFRSADCPVQQTNPPPAPPAHAGDHARLVTDVTVPDCSHQALGSRFVKVWRLRNLGTVPWRGYVLHRLDAARRDTCQTITDIPIANTAPGGFVDVRAEVIAPNLRTFCVVRFRVYDAAGVDAFPGGRPINFQVNVG